MPSRGRSMDGPIMKTRRLKVGKLTLRYTRLEGQMGRTPLLLLNGIGASLETVEPLLTALAARGLSAISLDMPGIGGSGLTVLPRGMSGYADLVARALDALEIPQVHLMGYSWGGALAQQFAYRYGGRVRSLVLACTAPGITMVPGRLSAYVNFFNPLLYRHGGLARLAGRTRRGSRLRPHRGRLYVTGMMLQLAAGMGWTSAHWLHKLPMPTLVVAGERDKLVPLVNARWLARAIPDAELFMVPGGTHLCIIRRAEMVAAAVARHISAHPRLDAAKPA